MIAQIIGLYEVNYVGTREKVGPTGQRDIQVRLGLKNKDNKKEATLWCYALCGVKDDYRNGTLLKDLLLDINFYNIKEVGGQPAKKEYSIYILDCDIIGDTKKEVQAIVARNGNLKEHEEKLIQEEVIQPKQWEVPQQPKPQEEKVEDLEQMELSWWNEDGTKND